MATAPIGPVAGHYAAAGGEKLGTCLDGASGAAEGGVTSGVSSGICRLRDSKQPFSKTTVFVHIGSPSGAGRVFAAATVAPAPAVGASGAGRAFAAAAVAPAPAIGAAGTVCAAVDCSTTFSRMLATPVLLFWRPSTSPICTSCVAIPLQRVGGGGAGGRPASPASMSAAPSLFNKRPTLLPMLETSLTIDGIYHGHLG